MSTMHALGCQKDQFSLPSKIHYLNCAYMAPLSKAVEAAGIRGVKRKTLPWEITPQDFFAESTKARAVFAQLIGADAGRIAIIPAVSYGIATVARNLQLSAGQSIVTLHEQFPSNVYAWRRYCKKGLELKTVYPPEGKHRAALWNEKILEAIAEETAVVSLPQVHWTDGTRFDLLAISKRAKEVGAALIIDGTQSVGAMPFDVAAIQPDALLVAGYKTLMGPYGLGFAYYGPRFDEGLPLEDNWITRKGSEDFSRLVEYQDAYAEGAVRFDVGERSNPILLPMAISAMGQILERGVASIQAYCQALTEAFLSEVQALGYTLEDEDWRSHHLFGIRLPKRIALESLKQHLAEAEVLVSIRGNALRVSPNVYNDEADIKALYEVLKQAAS